MKAKNKYLHCIYIYIYIHVYNNKMTQLMTTFTLAVQVKEPLIKV